MNEKTEAQQQVDALLAGARGAYPVCSMCGEDLVPHDGELCGACATSELNAAEARGRAAGIEEAAKRADYWYLHESHKPHGPGDAIRALLTQPRAKEQR